MLLKKNICTLFIFLLNSHLSIFPMDSQNQQNFKTIDEIMLLEHDQVLFENEKLVCLLDCQRRLQGGHKVKIFVYKDSEQHHVNLLENLNYSLLSKINKLSDNNHAFTRLVETYGAYGCIESVEGLPVQDLEFHNGYRFKYKISLPGRLTLLEYSIERASERGPEGTFEFTILKKNKKDNSGMCVHRFFRPNRS